MARRQYFKLSAVPWFVLFLVCVSFAGEKCDGLYEGDLEKFSLATGSPGDLGLVKVLAEAFNSIGKTTLCWQKAGSGDPFAVSLIFMLVTMQSTQGGFV